MLLFFSIKTNAQNIKTFNDILFVSYKSSTKIDSVHFNIKGGRLHNMLYDKKKKLWQLTKHIPNANELILQYQFLAYHNSKCTLNNKGYFIGDSIHLTSEKVSTLKGRIIQDSLQSKWLNENRNLSIYLPPNYNKTSKKHQVIYLTDGAWITNYAAYIEQLIINKQIPALVLIGVHSNDNSIKQFRTLAYLKDIHKYIPDTDSTLYSKHMKFFNEEVIEHIEAKFNVSNQQTDRIIFGCSNGAAFSLDASINYPNMYQHIILGSFGWLPLIEVKFKNTTSKYHLCAGTLEKDYSELTKLLNELLLKEGITSHYQIYVAAHDDIMWRDFFLKSLIKIFKQ
ncbi:alpha/beta hydrolase-fold protein [uncultured Psychroserpens sp.]|uniref:alpha/beta hydrolase n=1 Tax=uncultured Psychroserpens sp. TaxID=255436 RepID=UPI0026392788|nr:alpha/beta hydrolase-fold protein [uncultured Psychroserpens sp.]